MAKLKTLLQQLQSQLAEYTAQLTQLEMQFSAELNAAADHPIKPIVLELRTIQAEHQAKIKELAESLEALAA